MNDIEALVSLTVSLVPSRHWWQDVHPALRCETFVARANAVDNNPAWQAMNGHSRVITSAPLNDEDKDYND